MIFVKVDRDVLLEELYKMRSFADVEQTELKQQLNDLVQFIMNAPVIDDKQTFTRSKVIRGW